MDYEVSPHTSTDFRSQAEYFSRPFPFCPQDFSIDLTACAFNGSVKGPDPKASGKAPSFNALSSPPSPHLVSSPLILRSPFLHLYSMFSRFLQLDRKTLPLRQSLAISKKFVRKCGCPKSDRVEMVVGKDGALKLGEENPGRALLKQICQRGCFCGVGGV